MNRLPNFEVAIEKFNYWLSHAKVAEIAAGTLLLVGIEAGAAKVIAERESKPAEMAVGACALTPCLEELSPTTTTVVPIPEITPPATAAVPETTTSTAPDSILQAAAIEPPASKPKIMGVDISFPNCETPIPEDATFGIVGVNGGRPFTANPCLAQQAANFDKPALYVNTAYPGDSEPVPVPQEPVPCPVAAEHCGAYEKGWAAGKNSVEIAWGQGVSSREWWIDVETANAWRGNAHQHRTYILATMDAIRTYASANEKIAPGELYIGIYSTVGMMDRITRDRAAEKLEDQLWRPPGLHGWLATAASEDEVLNYCSRAFTGGGTVMVQTQRHNVNGSGRSIDVNYRC